MCVACVGVWVCGCVCVCVCVVVGGGGARVCVVVVVCVDVREGGTQPQRTLPSFATLFLKYDLSC